MPAYVITRSNVEALDTIVFSAGPNENEEAVAVFTGPRLAEEYLKLAGWQAEYTVATVEPIPFIRWLLALHDDGVQHLVIDPDHADQQAGNGLSTLSIAGQLEHAGKHIVAVARPDF